MRSRKGTFLIALSFCLAVVNTEEAATPDTQVTTDALSCALRHQSPDQPSPCAALRPDALPDRFHELLRSSKIPDRFREAAVKSDLASVSPADMAEVPVLVLIHMSANFLSSCSGRALSAVVRRHPTDAVVARAVLAALDLVDNEKRTRFIRELGLNSGLSQPVQAAIGEAAVRWWGVDMKEHSMDLATVGTPLLAALPPGYLAELVPERAANMLMRLRNYPWNKPNDPSWSSQPPETKRVWMEMFKKDSDSGKAQLITEESDGLKMLWAGATPEEINDLQFKDADRETLTSLRQLTKLQVRSFVSKLYSQSALSSREMNELFDWMLDLSPTGLQRFLANDTDFTNLPSADTSGASLATLKQVMHQVVSNCVIQGRITNPMDPGTWGRSLKDIGRLVYLIKAAHLENYMRIPNRLPNDVLAAVDTYKLSAMQALYLTNKGQFIDLRRPAKDLEVFHGLTRSIPTATLAALRTSSVSDGVLLHLLESIPGTHPARSAVLFNKMRDSLTDAKVLEAVLRNPQPGQYWSLVSSREVGAARPLLEKAFALMRSSATPRFFTLGDWLDLNLNKKDSIENHLRLVPADTLSAVLGSVRRELSLLASGTHPVVWTSDTLLSPDRPLVRGALLGLTCADVLAMDLVDFPVILATYNQRLEAAGLDFPKKLHHCLQRAMEDYLHMKKKIRRYGDDVPLAAVLEASDIQAFGGYLLSTLRPAHIHHSNNAELVLSSIGALSPQELLSALPSLEQLKQLALQMVDVHRARRSLGSRCLFALGNLHMFLPPDVISAIDPDAWKLFVEARAGRPRSIAVCGGSEQRDAWHRLAVKAFGPPGQWAAGVVAALGDALVALPADVMSGIRVSSWRDAADTLAERTVYHRPTQVTGSDYPLPYVEVCRSLLASEEQSPYYWSVRRTVRYYLRASHALVDTVETADRLVRRLQPRSSRTDAYRPGLRQSASSTTTTTTTTTLASSTYSTTEEAGSSTTVASTTTEDPFADLFGDFDDLVSSTPDWMKAVESTRPTGLPETVIIRDDKSVVASEDDSASSTTTVMTTLVESTTSYPQPTDAPIELEDFETAKKHLAVYASSAVNSTSAGVTDVPEDKLPTRNPSAMTLPTLPLSNDSDTAVATTPENIESVDKEETVDKSLDKDAHDPASNLVRRRRAADEAAEIEMEYQIARDVQLQVTCDGIRGLGPASALGLTRGDAEHMLEVEAEDCVGELATLRLGPALTKNFWAEVPVNRRADVVGDVGRLVSGMVPDEVHQLNLSLAHERVLDTLSTIGQHATDIKVLDAVALQLVMQNPTLRAVAGGAGGAGEVDADSLVVALGPVTCSLPMDVQRMLLSRRGVLQHAARSLQGVRLHCNSTCLEELARAAVAGTALGDVSTWTSEEVHELGVIVAGLNPDQLKLLQRPLEQVEQPVSGLTASAVACMTREQVQALGDHIAVLSPVAATAVTPVHQHELPTAQLAALLRVRNMAFTRHLGRPDLDGRDEDMLSSGTLPRPGSALVLVTMAAAVLLYGRRL